MTLIKLSNYILLLTALFLTECNSADTNSNKNASKQLSKYKLVKDWPQFPKTFRLSHVSAVDVDTNQNIFILQRTGREWTESFPDSLISLNTVFEIDKKTGTILNSWGAKLFVMPHGLTIDQENNVWITDVALNQVFKFDHNGNLLLKLGVAKIAGDDSLHFDKPTDVAITPNGPFYISDGYGNSRIIKFSKAGKYLLAWGKKGAAHGEFNIPHAITLDSHGNVFVADRENNRIQKFDSSGNFISEWRNNQANLLMTLSVDKTDNVFAVDNGYPKGDDVIQLDSSFNLVSRFGRSDLTADTSALFHDIAVDKERNIYVANIFGRKVQKFKYVPVR